MARKTEHEAFELLLETHDRADITEEMIEEMMSDEYDDDH